MTFASRRLAVIAAIGGLVLLVAPAAHAFTVEQQGGVSNGDGTRSAIADPDERVSRFGSSNGQSAVRQGNTTFQFGNRPSFNQQFNSDRLFDPGSRLNDER